MEANFCKENKTNLKKNPNQIKKYLEEFNFFFFFFQINKNDATVTFIGQYDEILR